MSYYDEIYKLRLNRYGLNYQERLQSKREKEFQYYLARSVYKIEFVYNEKVEVGSFEKYKQDETETLHYLLTDINVNIPAGTVLMLPDKDGVDKPWMVYYLERIKASGYNRYIMLRMTHFLTWVARDGSTQTSWAYMYGQQDNMLKDEFKARSRMDTVYAEALKLSFFVCPLNQYIQKDDYFIVGEKPFQQYFRVTGFDIQSSEGVEYVTIDPVYEYDLSAPPSETPEDNPEDFYWFDGCTTFSALPLTDSNNLLLYDVFKKQLMAKEDVEV